jgi:DNA polymerase-1
VIATAEKDGKVVDMWGREEYIPEIYSYFQHVRETGKRKSVNQGIQSGAQGIIKQAMRELWPKMVEWNKRWDDQKGGECVRPLLQVYDDLLMELRDEMVDLIIPQIRDTMENAVNISIPITTGVKVGKRWGSMKRWNGGE